jgi:hypothetical protein
MVKELLQGRVNTGRAMSSLLVGCFHMTGVMLRESEASSTPRLLVSITAVSEYWIAR